MSLLDYEIRARPDRHKNGGGLIEFVQKGLICKRLKNFETSAGECICFEITISKRILLCFSICRPPSNENLELFFEELTNSLSKASESYECFIITGDFNIDVTNRWIEFDNLDEFCDLFNLTNLISSVKWTVLGQFFLKKTKMQISAPIFLLFSLKTPK